MRIKRGEKVDNQCRYTMLRINKNFEQIFFSLIIKIYLIEKKIAIFIYLLIS
jgi:hypothetical protein